MKQQNKADKAFIEKIKTINIGGGSKPAPAQPPTCDDCGLPMIPVGVVVAAAKAAAQFAKGYRSARKLPNDEQSFSA